MNIQVYTDEDRIRHIAVNGSFCSKEDIDKLLESINNNKANNDNGISITFFEANILPVCIVEKLANMQRHGLCRIYVFKMYLYSYLNSLRIKCKYMRCRRLDRKRDHCLQKHAFPQTELVSFLEDIYNTYGYDYRNYQTDSLIRRIKVCMLKENINDFKEFWTAVLKDPSVFDELFQDFSINITEFFRDSEVLLAIRKKILPYLSSYMHIKIWCAGCSTGKEAYSIAILLHELGLLQRAQIYATDINPYVIEEAKNGLYPIEQVKKDILSYNNAGGRENFLDYFELKNGYMKVKDFLGENILFFQHSLTESGSLNEFELILCRNVMIYFNSELQHRVLENFSHSLDRNGFLVLGKSEGMMLNLGDEYFQPYMQNEKIYRLK